MIQRGVDCVNCGEFVVLDDVTIGIPEIKGGTPAPVPAYSLTPQLKCGGCSYETNYKVSDLKTRMVEK